MATLDIDDAEAPRSQGEGARRIDVSPFVVGSTVNHRRVHGDNGPSVDARTGTADPAHGPIKAALGRIRLRFMLAQTG